MLRSVVVAVAISLLSETPLPAALSLFGLRSARLAQDAKANRLKSLFLAGRPSENKLQYE